MPRPKRLNIPGVPQHLVQRGNDRQMCFRDETDYSLYLRLLNCACERHCCNVHAYVLMTNHVHILLTPHLPDGASLVFRDLGRDYVRQFNRKYGRTGTLWEGRFKSSLVDTNKYLLACYRYIELNPVRARMVASPADYPWSSFQVTALGKASELIVPHDLWLSLGDENTSRCLSYLSLFDSNLHTDQIKVIQKCLNTGLPTGDSAFMRNLEKTYAVKFGYGKRGRPRIRRE